MRWCQNRYPYLASLNIEIIRLSQIGFECVGLWAEFPSQSWLARSQEAVLKEIRKLVADSV